MARRGRKASIEIGLDVSELKKYAKNFKAMFSDLESFLEETARICGELAVGKLKDASPTQSGDLRKAWRVAGIKKGSNGYTVYLSNPSEHASYVNDGHMANPTGVDYRFVPGGWKGGRFDYNPDAEGGMMLKQQWVKGLFFMESGMQAVEVALPAVLEARLEAFLKKYDM